MAKNTSEVFFSSQTQVRVFEKFNFVNTVITNAETFSKHICCKFVCTCFVLLLYLCCVIVSIVFLIRLVTVGNKTTLAIELFAQQTGRTCLYILEVSAAYIQDTMGIELSLIHI